MSKHTERPWIKQHIGQNEWGAEVWTFSNLSGTSEIAETYTIENASLIAAAPDLLEALQAYTLPIDLNNIALSCIEFGGEAVERELKRRAAIAKATGEQQ